MIFRQLFDTVSSTYTYLLASGTGREAVLIDPVKDQLQQYLTLIADLDLKLVTAIDTHTHADHITALGSLRDAVGAGAVIVGLGLFVGLTLGLTGAGGAILAVPLLIFALNWDVARSAPVALVAVAASAALGAAIGLREGCVRYRAAMVMAATGAVVTPIGLFLAHRAPVGPLALLFSAVLLYVAWRMFRQARSTRAAGDASGPACEVPAGHTVPCQLSAATGRFVWTAPCAKALALSGLATGFLSGLLGVGGGFVIVPALRHTTDLPMNSIIATSQLVVALVSTFAVASSALTGHLDFAIAWPFAVGALIGMLAGRAIAPKIAGPKLQQGFAALAALVAVGLIVKTLLVHP